MLVQCWPSVETGQERYGVRNDGNVGPRPPEGRTYCERQRVDTTISRILAICAFSLCVHVPIWHLIALTL